MAQPLSETVMMALVRALADGAWHSGEALAAEAGISRAAVAKRIAHLGDWQLAVQTQRGRGYRLHAPIELLDAGLIRAALPPARRETLRALKVAACIDSTNTQLLQAGGSADPQALLAERQSGGRGRRGRHWVSPFGTNLYASLGYSFSAWPPQITALPLAVGVALAEWLHALGARALSLKWPNDLLADGRKLAGVLIEQRGEAGGPCRVVIGVGLNTAMHGHQADAIEQAWTTLQDCLPQTPARNLLAAGLLDALLRCVQQFAAEGFAPFRPRWAAFDASENRAVRIIQEQPWDGIARGVDADGALIVEAGGTRRRVLSGDVSLRIA